MKLRFQAFEKLIDDKQEITLLKSQVDDMKAQVLNLEYDLYFTEREKCRLAIALEEQSVLKGMLEKAREENEKLEKQLKASCEDEKKYQSVLQEKEKAHAQREKEYKMMDDKLTRALCAKRKIDTDLQTTFKEKWALHQEKQKLATALQNAYDIVEKDRMEHVKTNKDLQTTLNKVERELYDMQESMLCCVCMEKPREAVMIPCGHTFCIGCVGCCVAKCPTCSGGVVSVSRIYM